MSGRSLRGVLLPLALLAIGATFVAASHAGVLERAEAARYALVVSAAPEPSPLAQVLAQRYGFEAIAPEPTREGIREAVSRIYDEIRPYDQLVVYLALPVVRRPELAFVPVDGSLEEKWTLLDFRDLVGWLNELPTGGALLAFPSCGSRSPYGDPALEELAYAKRPGPVEILLVCDFEAMRVARRDPEAGYLEWRGDELAGAIAEILEDAAVHDHAADLQGRAMTSRELEKRLGGAIEGLEVRLIAVPLHEEPIFRFAHIATVDEYRGRYERGGTYFELVAVIQDYLAAVGGEEPVGLGLVTLLRDIALSPRAAAPSASLEAKEVLQLRSYAVEALTRLPVPEAREALRDIGTGARDESLVRRAAISALATSTVPDDLQAMRSAVEDEDPSVRESAVRGLVRAKDEGAADLLATLLRSEEVLQVRIAMIQGLSSFGRAEDRESFHSMLEDPHWGTRKEAIAALSRLEPDPETNLRMLAALTGDPVDSVRQTAAYALGRTWLEEQRGEIVAGLARALAPTPEPTATREAVRAAAASTMGRIGGAEVETALRAALGDADNPERLRISAAEGLGRMKGEAAIPELERAAQEPSPAGLRRAAVAALGTIGTPRAVEIVFSRVDDEDEYVRREAERWIRQLEVEQTTLQQSVKSPSAEVRQVAVYQLGVSSELSSLDALVKSLSDRDVKVRQAAIDSLAKSSNPATVDRMIAVLEDGDFLGRLGAAAVLGRIPVEDEIRVIEALAGAAEDANSDIRAAAVRALGSRGGEAARFVYRAATDRIIEVRLAAAWALGQIRSEAAIARLEELAKTDPSDQVRKAAAEALSQPTYRRSRSKFGG